MRCINCAAELPDAASFCEKCGANAPTVNPATPIDECVSETPRTTEPHCLGRGWVSAYLALMGAGNAFGAYTYLFREAYVREMAPACPPALIPILGFLCLANVVFVLGAWDLMRWGVYGLACTATIATIINIRLGVPNWAVLMGQSGIIILFLLLMPIWKQMRFFGKPLEAPPPRR